MLTMPAPVMIPAKAIRVRVRVPKCNDISAEPVSRTAIKAEPMVRSGS